jgi:hypothetical protein
VAERAELERRLGHANDRYLRLYTNPPDASPPATSKTSDLSILPLAGASGSPGLNIITQPAPPAATTAHRIATRVREL